MHLKAKLKKLLKLFSGDIRQAIVSYIVVSLILAGGGVMILTKTMRDLVIQIANIQSPIWATISLVLLSCLYTYLKVNQYYKKKFPSISPRQNFCLPDFFDYNGASWKIIYLPNQKIKVDFPSYCIQHHLQHIQEVHNYICPECGNDHIPVSPYFLKNIQEIHKIVNTICQQFTSLDRQKTGGQ